jgi:hypothetical protein
MQGNGFGAVEPTGGVGMLLGGNETPPMGYEASASRTTLRGPARILADQKIERLAEVPNFLPAVSAVMFLSRRDNNNINNNINNVNNNVLMIRNSIWRNAHSLGNC